MTRPLGFVYSGPYVKTFNAANVCAGALNTMQPTSIAQSERLHTLPINLTNIICILHHFEAEIVTRVASHGGTSNAERERESKSDAKKYDTCLGRMALS